MSCVFVYTRHSFLSLRHKVPCYCSHPCVWWYVCLYCYGCVYVCWCHCIFLFVCLVHCLLLFLRVFLLGYVCFFRRVSWYGHVFQQRFLFLFRWCCCRVRLFLCMFSCCWCCCFCCCCCVLCSNCFVFLYSCISLFLCFCCCLCCLCLCC